VLSFERYVMICRPFQKYNLSRSRALILVCAIWLYALCLTVPPLVGWGAYVLEGANIRSVLFVPFEMILLSFTDLKLRCMM
jgi:c-opsin